MTETTTLQIRVSNPEQTDKMAQVEEPDNEVYGYLARNLTDKTGDFIEVTIGEGDNASLDRVTSKGTGNYATFEAGGGAVVGFGISLSLLEDMLGFTVERDSDGVVQNAPESLGLSFSESTEDAYEEADSVSDEDVNALLAD